jgi:hypothetical protein
LKYFGWKYLLEIFEELGMHEFAAPARYQHYDYNLALKTLLICYCYDLSTSGRRYAMRFHAEHIKILEKAYELPEFSLSKMQYAISRLFEVSNEIQQFIAKKHIEKFFGGKYSEEELESLRREEQLKLEQDARLDELLNDEDMPELRVVKGYCEAWASEDAEDAPLERSEQGETAEEETEVQVLYNAYFDVVQLFSEEKAGTSLLYSMGILIAPDGVPLGYTLFEGKITRASLNKAARHVANKLSKFLDIRRITHLSEHPNVQLNYRKDAFNSSIRVLPSLQSASAASVEVYALIHYVSVVVMAGLQNQLHALTGQRFSITRIIEAFKSVQVDFEAQDLPKFFKLQKNSDAVEILQALGHDIGRDYYRIEEIDELAPDIN